MYQQERLLAIIQYLKEHKKISVEQICEKFNVSRDTARRDLVKLEEQEMIIRTRGGAMLPTLKKEIKNYQDRLRYVSKEKKAIGKLAASLIKDGDNIIMDTSTTVQACAEFINTDCSVITNSINQADILSNKSGVDIHLLGGQLNKEHRFLYGAGTLEKLNAYNVNKAFIGVVGITERGLMIAHEEDGFIKKKMIEQAEQVIVLADASKFENNALFTFAKLSQIDVIITDQEPDESFLKVLEEYEVDVLFAFD
ncbi:DeoR/GlpR family DNA-binding transcription regulator [Bacillus taeanensis]|uniref:DeoR/GlpR transcriptional regulator n=1 Tax=Bacillus taeanensis TaxID=273032 RepID=A0A366Y067_9BACI|nr:DeoR/GlpR family DNA-binding transcription regulator [Bacillus taeanensis]RBW71228.1 DeoR/GlpR transcriptional regulator [Bacillus taeanensis]